MAQTVKEGERMPRRPKVCSDKSCNDPRWDTPYKEQTPKGEIQQ